MVSKTIRLLIMLTIFATSFTYVPVTLADDISDTKGFRKAVTLTGIREHQAAFQSFADANNGTRRAGTPGYDASAQYVYDRMAAAGYNVSYQEFSFNFFQELTPAVLEQVAPGSVSYTYGVDFQTMDYSGSGDVTANVTAVDLVLPPAPTANTSNSGCEAADFASFPAGNIALLQRGTCSFAIKAQNAQAAGASGVVIFNEGQPGRTALILGTLGGPGVTIPVVGTTFALGQTFANTSGLVLHLKTNTVSEVRSTRNVIAETPTGDTNHVIVIGAHLDSVQAGPGINDDGSGSATILEVAEVFAQQGRVPRNKLRFMWYSAEESGLIGSTFYVNSLSQAERDKIELMLNFDMLNSPNFVRFVYDGNNSTFPAGAGNLAGPAGSGAIEQVFLDYFTSQGLANDPTTIPGSSDYGPFITVAGIPIGGLFTGATGIKTAAQATTYGGTAGQPYDACYHLACDNYSGTNTTLARTALDQMSDAVAHAVLLFSKRNFEQQPLVDPIIASSAAALAGTDSLPFPNHDVLNE